ncbi:MAG: DUF4290 domain-containing protein [Muribaculaceae bacterium]|nr:DUF4290 domain-containing protein [Muribaculaceae bacterium]
MTYNTKLKNLILPEYGRNIQQMVDYCLTIPDRDERTKCAGTIVKTMAVLFPKIREQEGYRQKLWDHLAIMSDFQLDIDWPVEVISAEARQSQPDKVVYTSSDMPYRHYGKSIQRMISRAVLMEPGEEKDALIMLLANHMKKLMMAFNQDNVEDARIFKDMAAMSHGEIILTPENHRLLDFQIIAPPSGKKKKKK